MGFINDGENFIEDGNMDDYSSSPSFEVIEEIKVSHGLFVSTRQVAMTFFHQIVPSQTLQVHLNPVKMANNNNHSIENNKAEALLMIVENQGSFLREFKAYVMGKLIKPSKNIASNLIVFVFSLLFLLGVYLKEEVEIWKPDVEEKCSYQSYDIIKWSESKEEVWFVGVKSEKGIGAVLKKIGIFLAISLALCTMWANHIIIVNP